MHFLHNRNKNVLKKFYILDSSHIIARLFCIRLIVGAVLVFIYVQGVVFDLTASYARACNLHMTHLHTFNQTRMHLHVYTRTLSWNSLVTMTGHNLKLRYIHIHVHLTHQHILDTHAHMSTFYAIYSSLDQTDVQRYSIAFYFI